MFLEFAICANTLEKSMIHGLFIQDEIGSDFAILIPNYKCAKLTAEFTCEAAAAGILCAKSVS